MDEFWFAAKILAAIYAGGAGAIFLLQYLFTMAFWGELRYAGMANWRMALSILGGALWSGLTWPIVLVRGFHNLRNSG